MKAFIKIIFFIFALGVFQACDAGKIQPPAPPAPDINDGGTDTGNPNNNGGTDTGNPEDSGNPNPSIFSDGPPPISIEGTWMAFDTDCDEGCPGNNPVQFTIDEALQATVTFTDGSVKEGTESATTNGILITFQDETILMFTFVDRNNDGQAHELSYEAIYFQKL